MLLWAGTRACRSRRQATMPLRSGGGATRAACVMAMNARSRLSGRLRRVIPGRYDAAFVAALSHGRS